jgi:integrase
MRGHLKKRSKSSWTAFIELPKTAEGKRKQKVLTFKVEKKKEAEALLQRYLVELDRGTQIPGINIPLRKDSFESFACRWLAESEGQIAGDTFETYKARCEHYLLPAFGKFLITAITKQHVVAFTQGLKTAKRLDRKKGPLSDRTIHHIWALLKQILDRAVMEQIIQRNPCDLMKPPKKNMPKPSGLEVAGMVAVLKGLRDSDLYSFVAVSTFTGFRRGELLGLTWADIDFEKDVLQIVRAATEPNRRRVVDGIRNRSVTTKAPKTTGSRRSHPVFGLLKDALLEQRAAQEAMAEELGWRVTPRTFVYTDAKGHALSPDAVSSAFYYAIRKLDLPTVNLKGLRTSYATAMDRQGVSLRDIADLLGQTNTKTTTRHYIMEASDNKVRAQRKLDKVLRPLLASKTTARTVGARGKSQRVASASRKEPISESVIKRRTN